MITHTVESCKYCNAKDSIITDYAKGQVACNACGAVLEDRIIDETYEGRNFGGENQNASGKDQNRVGGPMSPYSDTLEFGGQIVVKRNNALARMGKRTAAGGSNKLKIMKKLEDLGQKLDLKKSTIEKAKDLLEKIVQSKKLKGRSIECILASILYAACRYLKVPRALADISTQLELDKKTLSKCFNSIKFIIFPQNECLLKETICGLITSKCNILCLTQEVSNCCKEIAKLICDKEILAGKSPNTIVGTCILIACKLYQFPVDKKQISSVSNSSEGTIMSTFTKLMEFKNDIIPEAYKDKIENLDK